MRWWTSACRKHVSHVSRQLGGTTVLPAEQQCHVEGQKDARLARATWLNARLEMQGAAKPLPKPRRLPERQAA